MVKVKAICTLFVLSPAFLFAQKTTTPAAASQSSQAEVKLNLLCPLKKTTGKEPKEVFTWNPPDKKVTMISMTDSVVRSSFDGKVSNVSTTEDNRYEVVLYYKEFYMWYYGVTKPYVKIGQEIKAGDKIGSYTVGTELEFRLFRDEEPVDPREMLECKISKSQ